MSLGEVRGSCVSGGSLGSLFTDGRGCDPTWVVVCHVASQQLTDGWGQIFPKWPPPEKDMLLNTLESFASNVLLSQQATFTPVFSGYPPKTIVQSDPDSYGASALPWDPVHMKTCVHVSRMGSPFPPVPWSSCAQAPLAFNPRCSRGSFSQCQIPTHGSLMWGSELSLL